MECPIDFLCFRYSRPTLVPVADSVSVILFALQCRLDISPAGIESIVQLQLLFHHHGLILQNLYEIVTIVVQTSSEEELLTKLFERVHQQEHASSWLRQILYELFARISQPWLDFVDEWIGLRNEQYFCLGVGEQSRTFVISETRKEVDSQGSEMYRAEYAFAPEKVPAFITGEYAHTIFETGRNLRFLESHHPYHPLASPRTHPTTPPPKLEWKFSWTDVQRIWTRAQNYEHNMIADLHEYTGRAQSSDNIPIGEESSTIQSFDVFGKNEKDVREYIAASAAVLNQVLTATDESSVDRLHNLILHIPVDAVEEKLGDASNFAPPLSLASTLSFGPIISVQARLVNSACIRLFFKEHDLRSHLAVQRRFQLIGDGTFAFRISHALFDPDLDTAEPRQGKTPTGAASGLRLGSRENWPPASSELRLALMGILTECYHSTSTAQHERTSQKLRRELPGGLSFAVRNVSEEELQRCLDPDSIEALDFLRLQYKPPKPLEMIITATCLDKYDQLFKFLLRVLRMLYVVNQLSRDRKTAGASDWQDMDAERQRFRMEAHHFVSNVSGYFFEIGVGVTWQKLEDKLDDIERRIESEETEGVIGDTDGLHKLQEYHERVLDRILFSTFLRKRQKPVLKLLEDIFTLILTFARHTKAQASGQRGQTETEMEVRQIYQEFRKKLGLFISVCRGLSDRKGYGNRRWINSTDNSGLFGHSDLNEDGENSIGQLLLRLEITGYYSRGHPI